MLNGAPGETPNPGETPPVTPPVTPPATPPGSETPPAATWKDGSPFDPARAEEALTSARNEANKLKRDLAAAEAKVKASEDAKLSEAERLTKRVAELEASATTAAQILRDQRVQLVTEREARALEFVSETAAVRFLDVGRVEFDADGQPTNVKALLTEILKENPYLKATPTEAAKPKAIPETPAGAITGGLSADQQAGALAQLRRDYKSAF